MGQLGKIRTLPTGVPMIEWINTLPHDGLIRYLAMWNQERILLASPEALAEVLVSKNYDFEKPSFFRTELGRLLGVGLLLAEGDEHKRQRRNLLPAFAFRHVKDLYPTFWGKAREGVQAVTEHLRAKQRSGNDKEEGVIEVSAWFLRMTLDIIGIAGLGRDFGAIKDPDNEMSQAYRKMFKSSREAQFFHLMSLFLPPWFINLLPLKNNENIEQATHHIRATCADLIHDKKEKLARSEHAGIDILSVALESGGFTDEGLVDQMMTFLAAGHETTASAMHWAVYLLAKHKDIQERLRAEVRAHLPSIEETTAISSVDIDRLPYLNAVCNEVLRYYSPVALTMRQAARDTTIRGVHVPKGTRIVLCPWSVNRSEDMWGPGAKRFDPERWMTTSAGADGDKKKKGGGGSTGSGGAKNNYAFMTFLHGPRSCIGQSFARAEFACLVAAWVGRFSFELQNEEDLDEDKLEVTGSLSAKIRSGLYVKVRPVEGW